MFHFVQQKVLENAEAEGWIQHYKKEAEKWEDRLKKNQEAILNIKKKNEQYKGES